MKKIISQISLILLIITIGMTSVFVTKVSAVSSAGINAPSTVTEGENFKVALILEQMSNVYGATCTITITYSDGSQASQRLVYVVGMENSGFSNSTTFPAKVPGIAQINVTQIDISDPNANLIEEGGTKEQTINILPKTPEPTPESPTPSTPSTNQNQSGTSNGENVTNKEENKEDTKKEPEIVNPTFQDVNETVYALKGCNVRSSCSTEITSNKIGGLLKGQSVTRTGIEGTWSRIKYNGHTAYVATRLLTTEEPVEEEPEDSENTISNEVVVENTVIDNSIETNTIENNEVSNEQILNQIEQEIGVLPEVGHNIATILFMIISIVSLIVIMRLQYKSKENK